MGMANAVGANGAVLAFEPQKELAASVRKSLALQAEASFEVHETLLSNTVQEQVFCYNGTGRSRIQATWGVNGERLTQGWSRRSLRTITLDSIVLRNRSRKLPRVCLIKIDVEGHEFEVLEGAEEVILRDQPVVYIEVWQEKSEVLVRKKKWRTDHRGLAQLQCWTTEHAYEYERLTANDFILRPRHTGSVVPHLVVQKGNTARRVVWCLRQIFKELVQENRRLKRELADARCALVMPPT
jgi:FkbM family methyltransferase